MSKKKIQIVQKFENHLFTIHMMNDMSQFESSKLNGVTIREKKYKQTYRRT